MKLARHLVLVGYSGLALGWSMGLRLVTSPSVPPGIYRAHDLPSVDALKRGMFVCLRTRSDYAPAPLHETVVENDLPATWIKSVAGLPGDLVSRASRGAHLEINESALAHSAALSTDSQGRPLPAPALPIRLASEQVWLSSVHDYGYDSRYFGPVDVRALGCIAEPLWTM